VHALNADSEQPRSGRAVFPFPVHRTQLPNGLVVMSIAYDSPGIIAYYTVVRTGSRNEVEPGLSGFAHFFEHMMFRGTPRFSEQKYNEALKRLGADSNASTTDDWTLYHITASAAALETIVDLESDRFQNLKYDVPGFQKEARAVLGEYNKSASSPLLLLDEKMQDTAFTTHTYKHTTIGFLKDIEDMPNQYEYSLKFFDRWYRPENCIVLVVGDVEHDRLVQLAKKCYGKWQRGTARVEVPREPSQTEEKSLELKWKGRTLPYLYIGYHVPAFDPRSRDIAALDILAEAAFSETSPLYRKLVLQERKVEALHAGAPPRRDPTLFTILARLTADEHIGPVREEIYRTLQGAAASPIDSQRLADIQAHLRYRFATSLNTPDAIARTVGEFLELTGDADAINQLYATYEAVTAEDIQRVARKFFVPTNRTAIQLTMEQAAGAAEPGEPCGNAPGGPRRELNSTVLLNPSSPLVALRVALRTGSMHDPPGEHGLAALTARMLAEGGTKRLSYNEVLQRLYPMAGRIGSHCDKEVTVFTGTIHRDKLEEFYSLFSEMILTPRFDAADFARLREEQLNYVAKTLRGNDDETLGKWTLQLALYPDHPYGHVNAGSVSALRSITLDDVKSFYRANYSAGRLHLGVAGGADEAFVERLREDFAALGAGALDASPSAAAAGEPHTPMPEPHLPKDLELTIVQKDCIATAISIGFPLRITRKDDDFYALAVANSALGEHRTFNGRLMINMRGKRGLNYGDYSYIENFIQDGGSTFPIPNIARQQQYFSIWIRPVPHDKAVFALRQAIRELDLLVEHGLSEQDFQATRGFLENYNKLWVQTLSRRIGYEMDGAFYGRDSIVAELDRRLPAMTREQVNAAIRRHLDASNLAVAVVTRDAEAFRDAVLSGNPSPLVYDTEGTPADVLEEDKLIEVYPLKVNRERVSIVPVDQMFE
jgi:zinc protease